MNNPIDYRPAKMTPETKPFPMPRPGRRRDPRRKYFAEIMKATGGNLTETAKQLGISRKAAKQWYRQHQEGTLLDRLT